MQVKMLTVPRKIFQISKKTQLTVKPIKKKKICLHRKQSGNECA